MDLDLGTIIPLRINLTTRKYRLNFKKIGILKFSHVAEASKSASVNTSNSITLIRSDKFFNLILCHDFRFEIRLKRLST